MKKLLTNKWVLIGLAAVAAYFIFCPAKADAATLELGQYENRIDGGLYTGEGSYAILSGEVGIFGASVEYVDADDSQLYTTIETGLSTPIGDVGVYGLLSSAGDDDVIEVGATYGLSLFGIDTILDLAIDEDQQYTADITTEYDLFSNESFGIVVGGTYGKSFEYATDYDYTLGFARIETSGDIKLFAQVNYLQNDLYSDSFEATTDFGLSLEF